MPSTHVVTKTAHSSSWQAHGGPQGGRAVARDLLQPALARRRAAVLVLVVLGRELGVQQPDLEEHGERLTYPTLADTMQEHKTLFDTT